MASSFPISVIIPVLNEAQALPLLLRQLREQRNVELELVVVDGGSDDESAALAQANGAIVISSQRGRPLQLNAGAKQARFDTLLFLHADSKLPSQNLLANAVEKLASERERLFTHRVAGHFKLKFDTQTPKHALAFRFLEEKSACNRPQTINGDQGLLIGKHYFNELGGFDEHLPVMEDQAIAQRIFDGGHWLLLPGTLYTSARRFEREGFHRRYLLMSLMMGLYWTGAHDFFARAKNVYAPQSQTGRLKLWPFFKAVWAMLIKDFGWRRSFVQWYRVGRYVRQQSWQLFFWLDVCCRPWLREQRYPLTRFHNVAIQPITDNKLFDALTTVLVFVWYMLILAPAFFMLDRFIRESRPY